MMFSIFRALQQVVKKLHYFFRDSKLVIDGYLECLCSSDPEIVMSAAKVLSEISILAAGQCLVSRRM